MSELLIPVDAELEVIAELRPGLVWPRFTGVHSGVQVGTKIPARSPKPDAFVRVVASGGVQRDLVTDDALLVVDAFCVDEGDARDLAAFVVAVLQRAGRSGQMGDAVCFGVSVAGLPVNLPDPDVPTHFRYQVTVSVALRRTSG